MTDTSERKLAIVTGGSRGLGRSTVLHLARRGVDTIFTYNASEDAARAVASQAEKRGARSVPLPLNGGDDSSFDGFVAEVKRTLGEMGRDRFDHLVNNAGISNHTAFSEVSEEEDFAA